MRSVILSKLDVSKPNIQKPNIQDKSLESARGYFNVANSYYYFLFIISRGAYFI